MNEDNENNGNICKPYCPTNKGKTKLFFQKMYFSIFFYNCILV